MARHRSPQGRHASLPLLSPRFAVAGAGGAGGYHLRGPHVRHARAATTGTFPSRSARVAAALVACGGVAGAAHASTQGTFLPDAAEVSGWFAAADAAGTASVPGPGTAAVPAPRAPGDAAIADPAAIAPLSAPAAPGRSAAATSLGPALGTAPGTTGAGAVAAARNSARAARSAAAAATPAPPAPAPAAAGSPGSAVQIVTGRVSSGFGIRWGVLHAGLDIAAPIGTPIRVPLDGTVISSGPASGFGLWVRVRHDDGTITVYGHINRSLVRVGQRVTAGQQIAEVGNRGQTTGPHLHIEVVQDGKKINPRPWLDQHGFRYS